jgi:hypothetical protein
MSRVRNLRLLALMAAIAVALVAVACGDDDDNGGGGGGEATAQEADAGSQQLRLNGETTVLVLDPGTAGVLERNDVRVAPVDPAAPDGEGIGFPVTGGMVDAESLAGMIDHSGGLRRWDEPRGHRLCRRHGGRHADSHGGRRRRAAACARPVGPRAHRAGRCHRRLGDRGQPHAGGRQGAERHFQGKAVRGGARDRRRDRACYRGLIARPPGDRPHVSLCSQECRLRPPPMPCSRA